MQRLAHDMMEPIVARRTAVVSDEHDVTAADREDAKSHSRMPVGPSQQPAVDQAAWRLADLCTSFKRCFDDAPSRGVRRAAAEAKSSPTGQAVLQAQRRTRNFIGEE